MDFKAVISNCGNEKVYKGLSSEVERRLPTAPVQWKRSFGRASKEVVLQASFSTFNSDQLVTSTSVESFEKLTTKPLLHIFWTSCTDNDKYKSSIKGQISNWQKHLNTHQNVDWLVVHVLYQENSKSGKSKIQLPRSSVYDKIKSDFGQDRCIQLWEPDKETLFTKSSESWETLLMMLRSSLLDSFGRHLDKFEEKIRSMREKYADPLWPFVDYFLVHEDLAFIYQSITLNEDALIQYDEVDALLSQFIINSSGKALPKWLEQLSACPKTWDGVLLSTKVADQYKTLIKSKQATLLDLRNYLFLRQCKVLTKMKRKWEIPPRLLEFLFAVIHELKILKVDVPDYVVACWIVLTCQQVLPVLEKEESSDHSFRANVAQSYDLMRQKIHFLGEITGVYFNRTQTEGEKAIVEHLKTGFGKYTLNKNKSVSMLQEALENRESFEKLYIEVTQTCIDKYVQIGRLHSNMFVGIDLAKFHLQHGRYLEAEPLLEKSWSIYKSQKWETLYTDVLIPLAACQLKHELFDRYLNSVTLLSCATCLSAETRDFYSKEVLRLSEDEKLNLPVTSSEPAFRVVNFKLNLVKMKGHIGDRVEITVVIINGLTIPIQCQKLSVNAKHFDLSNPDSFSENVLSARKSLFENKDYGMSISTVSPQDRKESKEETIKEALTPSNLLKRIKSHRRTWSRNKNTLESTDTKTDGAISTTGTGDNQNRAEQNETTGNNDTAAKRELFIENGTSAAANKKASVTESTTNRKISKEGGVAVVSGPEGKSVPDSSGSNEGLSKQSSLLELAKGVSDDNISEKTVSDTSNQPDPNEAVVAVAETEHPQSESGPAESLDLSLDLSQICGDDASTPKKNDESITNGNATIQPDMEENLDVVLESLQSFRLDPGENQVKISATISHEGKYTMQCVNCFIGNIHFYKQLKAISRKLGSFYMVKEPPHVTWTTSYLIDYSLTGSKQRIHVTIMNGPGIIQDGAILKIFSKTGLRFYVLDSSSIEVFPLEREGKAREAAITVEVDETCAYLKLPKCKPYERVNVYFDVMAPMHQEIGQSNTCQQEIHFVYQWLEHLAPSTQRLDVIFYEPFQLKHEAIVNSSIVILKITVCGVNPVHLVFSNPSLLSTRNGKTLDIINGKQTERIFNNEETTYLWKINPQELNEMSANGYFDCIFSMQFKTKDDQETAPEQFEKSLSISVGKCLFSVSVDIVTEEPKKGKPCIAHVQVQKLSNDYSTDSQLCLKLDPREYFWRLDTKEEGLELNFTDGGTEFSIDVDMVCSASGVINTPLLSLCTVDNVRKSDDTGATDVVNPFGVCEVDYLSAGKMTLVHEVPSIQTDV